MDLPIVVKKLQEFAPLHLAGSWDNVGLLTEPTGKTTVSKVLLTNDLSEKVMDEAIQQKVNMILSYHPPIFAPIKRLTTRDPKDRIILKAIENKIAIYSPHSALDAIQGGINDWLAGCLGEAENVKVLQPQKDSSDEYKIVVFVPKTVDLTEMLSQFSLVPGVAVIGNYSLCSFTLEGTGSFFGNESTKPAVGSKQTLERVDEYRLEFICPKSKLTDLVSVIKKVHPYETPAYDIYNLETVPSSTNGQGRLVTLKEKTPLVTILNRIKEHLKLEHLRLGLAHKYASVNDASIKTIAICAGSGNSVVSKTRADLYFTGEMGHHEVLHAAMSGTTVVLTEHSNCERGYLSVLKQKLENVFNKEIEFSVTAVDEDPLKIF